MPLTGRKLKRRPSARYEPPSAHHVDLGLTGEELADLEKRAKISGLSPEAWAKAVLLNALALAESIERLTKGV